MLHPQLIQSMHGGQQDRVFNLLFASANSLLDTSHMGQHRQGFNFQDMVRFAKPARRKEATAKIEGFRDRRESKFKTAHLACGEI